MATTVLQIPSSSTFNALTNFYTAKFVEDNLFLPTPLLTRLKQGMRDARGAGAQPLIEYRRQGTTEAYGRGDVVSDVTTLSNDIETRAQFQLARYRQKVLLDSWDTDQQGPRAIVSLFNEYVQNTMMGLAEDLASSIYNDDPDDDADNMTGLDIALDDTEAWGMIDPTVSHYEFWRPHFVNGYTDGTHAFGTAVPPSLAVQRKIIRLTKNTVKSKPTIGVVLEDLWDCYAAQLTNNETIEAKTARVDDDTLKYGFDAIWIAGVPIVEDTNMLGEDWVSGQTTRAAAKGYQTLYLNLDKLWLGYNPTRSFKFDPDGWRRPTNMDAQINYIYAWLQILGNNRRANARVWNQDITMTVAQMAAQGLPTNFTRPVAT